ncbi:MAG: RHS repeat-associated core domain-containing protein [Pseudomonas sp.]
MFYQNSQLALILDNGAGTRLLSANRVPIAESRAQGLPALQVKTDSAGSTLATVTMGSGHSECAYNPFGYSSKPVGSQSHRLFNAEVFDNLSQGYHLGAGERVYLPALMRFGSPDTMSPFGEGGINWYAYCSNDPINFNDPSGNNKVPFFSLQDQAFRALGISAGFERPVIQRIIAGSKKINQNYVLWSSEPDDIQLKLKVMSPVAMKVATRKSYYLRANAGMVSARSGLDMLRDAHSPASAKGILPVDRARVKAVYSQGVNSDHLDKIKQGISVPDANGATRLAAEFEARIERPFTHNISFELTRRERFIGWVRRELRLDPTI